LQNLIKTVFYNGILFILIFTEINKLVQMILMSMSELEDKQNIQQTHAVWLYSSQREIFGVNCMGFDTIRRL